MRFDGGRLWMILGGGLALALILLPLGAHAQDVAIDLGDGESLSLRTVQLFLALTLLSLAPGLAIMVTCFPFIPGYSSNPVSARVLGISGT